MENNLVPFNFEGISLRESCWIDGRPYYTRRAIGEFLEYKKPQEQIDFVVRRNPHISAFATHVSLTCVEGSREVTREVEVYDPIGLQLIINKSNQPKAIVFQVAVAHLVLAFVLGKLVPSKWSPKGDFSAINQILSALPNFKRKNLVIDYAEREKISLSSAYRRISKAGRLLTRSGKPRRSRKA